MAREDQIVEVLNAVGKVLLDKGDGYSIGKLVAELEGDGSTLEEDPASVWDRHFYADVIAIDEWPDEPRSMDEVDEVIEAFEKYWLDNPDYRFCQIVTKAHIAQNGLGDFKNEDTWYESPIGDLSDEQLVDYLANLTNGDGGEE